MNTSTYVGEAMEAAPDPRWENERLLLEFAKKQLNITEDDMRSFSSVKSKIRDFKIEDVLQK